MFGKKIKNYRKTKLESYLTGVLFCVIFFSGFLAWGNAMAAEHYIRPDITDDASLGCQYNGDGTTWSCASGTGAAGAFNTIPASASFVRGDTYYLSSGTWGAPGSSLFEKAVSGELYIYIKKATTSAHGTDVGWISELGTGQAAFVGWYPKFTTGYWDIDGVVGGGSNPASYGIYLIPPENVCETEGVTIFSAPYFSSPVSHMKVKHLALNGCDVDKYPTSCTMLMYFRPSNLTGGGWSSNYEISNNYFGGLNQNAIYGIFVRDSVFANNYFAGNNSSTSSSVFTSSLNAAGSGYTVNDILSVIRASNDEDSFKIKVDSVDGSGGIAAYSMEKSGSSYAIEDGLSTTGGSGTGAKINVLSLAGGDNCHGETFNLRVSADIDIKNNIFTNWNLYALGFHSYTVSLGYPEGSNIRTRVYNNIFDGADVTTTNWIIGNASSAEGNAMLDLEVFHNVFLNIVSGYMVNPVIIVDEEYYSKAYNNIFYNVNNPIFPDTVVEHDYNAYLKCTGTIENETNDQRDDDAANPFVDSANGDYRLNIGTLPINNGKTDLGATYVLDYAGTERGASPDIGAYEYVGTSDTVAPASPSGLSVT